MTATPKLRRLGLFGGSFNPVHSGHVLLARQALEALRLDAVWLLPCAASADRKALAPAGLRLAWLRKALKGERGLEACDWELKRGGVSRSIDTLREARRVLGPKTRLFLLVGQDQWERFGRWKEAAAIPALAEVAVWPRGPKTSGRGRPPAVWMNPCPFFVSSTEIRHRIRANKTVTLLLPPPLAQEKGLIKFFKSY